MHAAKRTRPLDRATTRSLILGPRCATVFRRTAEKLEEKNRTDHVLQKPDKLTCYLQKAIYGIDLSRVVT